MAIAKIQIYCEHGALSADLRALQREGCIELVHFPYDEGSTTKHISPSATVSAAQWRDLSNVTWDTLDTNAPTWDSFAGSDKLDEIRKIIGSHRRDTLHVDSAYKTGCRAFVTKDGDILAHRQELETLLGMRFFHPERDAEALRKWIADHGPQPGK